MSYYMNHIIWFIWYDIIWFIISLLEAGCSWLQDVNKMNLLNLENRVKNLLIWKTDPDLECHYRNQFKVWFRIHERSRIVTKLKGNIETRIRNQIKKHYVNLFRTRNKIGYLRRTKNQHFRSKIHFFDPRFSNFRRLIGIER